MASVLVICALCNHPYVDNIESKDKDTECPVCFNKVNLNEYQKSHICDLEMLFWKVKD